MKCKKEGHFVQVYSENAKQFQKIMQENSFDEDCQSLRVRVDLYTYFGSVGWELSFDNRKRTKA